MRVVHVEGVDLNLLRALSVLLEERHITRAATRFHLSQSAMSRTLSRLRETFHDELLVRTASGYELTPRARALQGELDITLSRLHAMIRGEAFDPAEATDTIRAHCTDYATTVVCPMLFPQLFHQAPKMSLTLEPLGPHTFEDIERGRVDLALSPIRPPESLHWRTLFHEDFVCLLARDHPVTGHRVTIADLARHPRVTVVVMSSESMIADSQLGALGLPPASGLRVPYFSAAAAAVPDTTLIATLPRRFAARYAGDDRLRIAEAPAELTPFGYGLVWHPRLTGDPAHRWIRALVETAGQDLS
jgi:DNA-binding transcriptional LysR family regulator